MTLTPSLQLACKTKAEVARRLPFLQGAEKEGMVQLRGHRSAGGMRASIYNAMPLVHVERLRDYMHRFEQAHT